MSDQTHERFHERASEEPTDSGTDHDSELEWGHGSDHDRDRDGDGADLSCPAARRAAHRRLACELEACPYAMGVQYSAPGEGPDESAYASTELLAQVTLRGTVHPRVQTIVTTVGLGFVDVVDANSPDYKRVVVR